MNLLQNLIHESLIATGHVECAAVIRRKDSSIRATSVGYTVSVTRWREDGVGEYAFTAKHRAN